MKIKHLLLPALSALFAVSCVTDVTEDAYIGPEGQTYFDMSFSAASSTLDTKVGLDPTGESGSYLYWTETDEEISIVDATNNKFYATEKIIYTPPKDGERNATFEVTSFEVPQGSTEVSIFALAGDANKTAEDECKVSVPELTLSHYDDDGFNYDNYSSQLPFISTTETSSITTTADGFTSYDGDAPTLTMVPFFRAAKVLMSNIDTQRTEAEVEYIKATITLEDGIHFIDELQIAPSALSFDGDVNAAVTNATTETTETNNSTITTTVSYESAKSFADLKSLQIPLASLSTSADMYGKEFTVNVEFYNNDTDMTLLASCEHTYTATADFGYGEFDDITPTAEYFTYDLNKAQAVSDFELTAQGLATPEVLVEWTYPADVSRIEGVTIYYGEVDGENEITYTQVMNVDSEAIESNGTDSYVLGTNEALDWTTEYSIYVATTYGTEETETTPETATTLSQVDIRYNATTDIYEIFTAKGLLAFEKLVKGEEVNIEGLVTATTDDSEFPTEELRGGRPTLDAQVMATIDMAGVTGWSSIYGYQGTFDGGNGLSDGKATGIAIKNLAPNKYNSLFKHLNDGATIKNITLTDVVVFTDSSNIGTISTETHANANVTISYCEVSGSVTSDYDNDCAGGFVGYVWAGSSLTIDHSTNNTTVTADEEEINSTSGFVGSIGEGATLTITDSKDTVAGKNVSAGDITPTTVAVMPNAAYNGIDVKWTAVEGAGSDDVVVVYYKEANEILYEVSAPTKLSEGVVNISYLAKGKTYDVYVVITNYLKKSAAAVNGGTSGSPLSIELTAPDSDIVYDATNEVYEIYTADGLMTFAKIVNEGTDTDIPTKATTAQNGSANAKIMATIDMSGKAWTPMSGYSGEFDGGSASFFEIQNLTGGYGLFKTILPEAKISDVTLVSPVINNTETASSLYIGAIASVTEAGSTITNCEVKGGSVTASDASALVGALVGVNQGSISNSSSSCKVTVAGNVFNGGTDSCLVGKNESDGTVEDCEDDYTEGEKAAPAEAATIATAIPMLYYIDFNGVPSIDVTVSYESGSDNVTSTKVMYKMSTEGDESYEAMTESDGTYTASGLEADVEYTICAVTYNYLGAETKGATTTVTTYGENSYNEEVVPTITATANGITGVITLTWETEGLSESLQGFTIRYNGVTESIDAATIATGTATLTTQYSNGVETITYDGNYAPTAESKGKISKGYDSAITIDVDRQDIALVNDTYEIYTAKGLLAFAQIVNGVDTAIADIKMGDGVELSTTAVADADAKVMVSIELAGTTWLPIANYAGTFDGGNGGVTPTEVAITGLAGAQGLFASTAAGATIENVTLTADITATADYTGILVSTSAGGTIYYCNTQGSIDGGKQYTSGIVGKNTGEITIGCCTNRADVAGSNNVAGILGSRNALAYINYCENSGDISASAGSAGGVSGYAGNFSSAAASCEIVECHNYGSITATTSAAGIVGALRGGKVNYCYNEGTISGGSAGSAGIIGVSQSYAVIINSSENRGIVHVTGDYAGGILGTTNVNTTISGPGFNYGNVNSESATAKGIGGIVGCITTQGTLSGDYFNEAPVTLGGTLNNGEITGGKAINNFGYGVVGSGSAEDRVTGASKDFMVTAPKAIEVTKFEVSDDNEAIYNVEWTYAGDDASSIADVVVYTKTTGDYAVANTIEVNGDNTVNSTTLTFASNSTNYVYLMSSNAKGERMATTSLVEGELSAENPFTAVIADIAIVADMTYDATSATYSIHNTKGLLAFANLVNGAGNTGSAIVLNSDNSSFAWPSSAQPSANAVVTESIDLTGETWTPMTAYAGTFDGGNGGATPTEVAITGLTGTQGLFATIDDGAEIKNITITVDIQGASSGTGAVVCSVITSANVSVSYCNIYGNVWASKINNQGKAIGSAIGQAGEYTVISISHITNNATIQGSQDIGGIIGAGHSGHRPTITMTDCTNNGEVAYNQETTTVGGIYGYGALNPGSSLTRCSNTAPIKGTNAVGGLIGNINSNNGDVAFTDCSNSGAIEGTTEVGGFVGSRHNGGNYKIVNSSNSGSVTGQKNVGGFIGLVGGTVIFEGDSSTSKNTGVVKATTDVTSVGGFVGINSGTLTITNYTNEAAVYNNSTTLVNGAGGKESFVGDGTATTTSCTDNYYDVANE